MKESKRVKLLKSRDVLIMRILKIHEELHLGRKIGLEEAQKKEYNCNFVKKGNTKIGCRVSLPLCLIGKKIKINVVGEMYENDIVQN